MSLSKIDSNNFEQDILNFNGTAILLFTAPWCPACQEQYKILFDFINFKKNSKICFVDIDDSPDLVDYYKIEVVPVSFIFKSGALVDVRNEILSYSDLDKIMHCVT